MKNLITIIIATLIVGFAFSCKKDDSSRSKVLILVKSKFTEASLAKSELTGASTISKSMGCTKSPKNKQSRSND